MFDVLVVGGGHAGTEAACASARRGANTALITFDRRLVGALSCNPSIGGVGKGHLVREIDAFDGLMARAADRSAIHHRMLNRSKGTAVRGPRVQVDRVLYARAIRRSLRDQHGLTIIDDEVLELFLQEGRVGGVRLADGSMVPGRTVVLATGTFLGARIYRGDERHEGGRTGERAATALAGQLRAAGLPMGRLKTGTPPRLDGRTIDWVGLAEQPSDAERWSMSGMPAANRLPQVSCAITHTAPATHDVIRRNFGASPLFTGAIGAPGPRYCPSIEDKVQRFGDRDGHQIFLEPEGLRDHVVYPNGLSTSLPTRVQQELLSTIPGLRRAVISTPGYAVEYDFVDPRALDRDLALSAIPGVFCAGQINGTTGYEEAAGQGLIAGLNAAGHALGLEPVILDRASSYLGVMIDDLTLQGVTEPYRMLTARAEFRLSLRSDNAETRLGETAKAAGCLSAARAEHQAERASMCGALRATLSTYQSAAQLRAGGAKVSNDSARKPGVEWLRTPGVTFAHLLPDEVRGVPADVIDEVVEDSRYAPYLERQKAEARRLRSEEQIALPIMRFADVPGLSTEMVARLTEARPQTLAAAARVRGVTPAALSAVLLHTRRVAA